MDGTDMNADMIWMDARTFYLFNPMFQFL